MFENATQKIVDMISGVTLYIPYTVEGVIKITLAPARDQENVALICRWFYIEV